MDIAPDPKRLAVLGLGNPVLGDDGVGLQVAAAVRRLLDAEPVAGAVVLTSTRAGFELIDLLTGFEQAVIVDCLCNPQGRPGRVCRLSLEDFAGSARLVNQHGLSLSQAFGLARQINIPMPGKIDVLAVEAADAYTLSEELSPEVAVAVEPLAREIHTLLQEAADS